MAGVFLVTLYEYSPLFYIGLVSLCFVITAAIVLGWIGFDVPLVLRSSDDAESILPTPEKQMVQVTNPFALEIGTGPASVTDGMSLKPCCLEPCVLSCFWGCEVRGLHKALQMHQHCLRLSTSQHFQDALHLHCHYHQSFHIGRDNREEHHTQIPAEQGITDFGPLPRERYPLVAVLTLAEAEAREAYNIVASVTVVHVPDDKYNLSARVVFQYLFTSQGNMHELKPLFMSADSGREPWTNSEQSIQPGDAENETSREEPALEEEEEWSGERSKDCVVCQNAAVNKVLLPCRHTCVCNNCVSHFQHCPICRTFIIESFTLIK